MRLGGRQGRQLAACAATVAILAPLVWYWQSSLLPDSYSVMDMGYADHGVSVAGTKTHAGHGVLAADTATHAGHGQHGAGRSVTSLTTDPTRPADVSVTLTARKQRYRLASGRTVSGYTLDGRSPGPLVRATVGQLVQVRLVNESVPDGVTLHWHGVDVPNSADGVAGVTQDAVGVGQQFTYRFVADRAGTFWYHSHQVSHEQVRGGLLGALVVAPAVPPPDTVDMVAVVHLYQGVRTVNGQEQDVRVEVPPGRRARVRVVNTENGEMAAWVSGAPWRLVAVDGTDLHGATPVRDTAVAVAGGGRADLEVTMPADGSPVRVDLGGSAAVVLGSRSSAAPATRRPAATLDLLSYGTPARLGFDPERPDRRFDYVIGRRPGFLNGRPGNWWTINGHLFPDVPMFVVSEGDIVRMHIANRSGEAHPMHLHGHHAVVLARNGVPARGSPWWTDSLTVGNGDSYDVAFRADNPGIWIDHCHNLPHAVEGLIAHLMYEGVSTPFAIGGSAGNEPE
jgi:FtsP/CotA-like multicopper oxidase with cupredoxin domain